MKNILNIVDWIENHKFVCTVLFGLLVICLNLIFQIMPNKPVFYAPKNSYKIVAVHQYEKSDDASGYKHLGQNSRPDQWEKLIIIESSLFGWRHKIVPKNSDDILTVVVNLWEKNRNIYFNQ